MSKIKALYAAFAYINASSYPCCCLGGGSAEKERAQEELQDLREAAAQMEEIAKAAAQREQERLVAERDRLQEEFQRLQREAAQAPALSDWKIMSLDQTFAQLLTQNAVPNDCKVLMCNNRGETDSISARYTMWKHGFEFFPGKLNSGAGTIDFTNIFNSHFYDLTEASDKQELLFVWEDKHLPVTAEFNREQNTWSATRNEAQPRDFSDEVSVEIENPAELCKFGELIGENQYCVRMISGARPDCSGKQVEQIDLYKQKILVFDKGKAYSFSLSKSTTSNDGNKYFFPLADAQVDIIVPDRSGTIKELIKVKFAEIDPENSNKYFWKILSRTGNLNVIQIKGSGMKFLKGKGVPEGCKVFKCIIESNNSTDLLYTMHLHGLDLCSTLSYLQSAAAIDFEELNTNNYFYASSGQQQKLLFVWDRGVLCVNIKEDHEDEWSIEEPQNLDPVDISSQFSVRIKDPQGLIDKVGNCKIGENKICLRMFDYGYDDDAFSPLISIKYPVADIWFGQMLLFDNGQAYLFSINPGSRSIDTNKPYYIAVASPEGALTELVKISFNKEADEYSWKLVNI